MVLLRRRQNHSGEFCISLVVSYVVHLQVVVSLAPSLLLKDFITLGTCHSTVMMNSISVDMLFCNRLDRRALFQSAGDEDRWRESFSWPIGLCRCQDKWSEISCWDALFLDPALPGKKVVPKYDVLGWYSSGSDVQDCDMRIHKAVSSKFFLLSRFCSAWWSMWISFTSLLNSWELAFTFTICSALKLLFLWALERMLCSIFYIMELEVDYSLFKSSTSGYAAMMCAGKCGWPSHRQ